MSKKINTSAVIEQVRLSLLSRPIPATRSLGPQEYVQPKRRIFVVAGNVRQFEAYCRDLNLHPHVDAKYVTRLDQVRGLRGEKLVLYGTWYEQDRMMVNHIIGCAKDLQFEIEYA